MKVSRSKLTSNFSGPLGRMAQAVRGNLAGLSILLACVGGVSALAFAQPKAPESIKRSDSGTDQDVLVLKDGTILTGTIVSETKTTIKFKRVISGIAFEEEIEVKKVAEIKKASKKPSDAKTPAAAPAAIAPSASKPADVVDAAPSEATKEKAAVVGNGDGNTYYWMTLNGSLGREITQTPIGDAVKDALNSKADLIIIELNASFNSDRPPEFADYIGNNNASEALRVEPIVSIFTSEMEPLGDATPRLVCWVRQARGPIAPLPFVCPEIYFAPDAFIGALGGLESLFDGVGDEVVREKQRSLRLGHLEGICRTGGYDDRLMRAMTRREFVLTLGFDSDGKAVLLERLPESPTEELLTDSGKDASADNMVDVIAGRGDDYLTIDARRAKLLNVSKGTVSSKDQLLLALGLERSGREIQGKSKRIMDSWRSGLERAERQIRDTWDDFRDVRLAPPGEYNERKKFRSTQIRHLKTLIQIQKQWAESLDPRRLNEWQIPGIVQIEDIINRIELEQTLDKR